MIRYIPRYTEVLINLLENERTKAKIDEALSSYPLYTSTSSHEYIPNIIPTRDEINKKILDHYKYREIGFETVGRFLDELEITMNEIMPYYNQLMFTMDQDYDIKYNADYTRTINRQLANQGASNSQTNASTSSTTVDNSTVNNYNKNVKSDTPQDSLSIVNTGIDTVTYANELGFNHDTNTENGRHEGVSSSTGSGSQTSSTNETEGTTEAVKGNYGQVSVQSLIEHYRKLILNIVQDIINDDRIKELFMNIY